MNDQSFTTIITVDKTPQEAFDAINNVCDWWTGEFQGDPGALGNEFTYEYKPYHYSLQRVTEFVPYKKIVWEVIESSLSFLKKKDEWNGTSIIFEIAPKGSMTEVRFTHSGLVPEIECYDACTNAWGSLINKSLRSLIATGVTEKTEF